MDERSLSFLVGPGVDPETDLFFAEPSAYTLYNTSPTSMLGVMGSTDCSMLAEPVHQGAHLHEWDELDDVSSDQSGVSTLSPSDTMSETPSGGVGTAPMCVSEEVALAGRLPVQVDMVEPMLSQGVGQARAADDETLDERPYKRARGAFQRKLVFEDEDGSEPSSQDTREFDGLFEADAPRAPPMPRALSQHLVRPTEQSLADAPGVDSDVEMEDAEDGSGTMRVTGELVMPPDEQFSDIKGLKSSLSCKPGDRDMHLYLTLGVPDRSMQIEARVRAIGVDGQELTCTTTLSPIAALKVVVSEGARLYESRNTKSRVRVKMMVVTFRVEGTDDVVAEATLQRSRADSRYHAFSMAWQMAKTELILLQRFPKSQFSTRRRRNRVQRAYMVTFVGRRGCTLDLHLDRKSKTTPITVFREQSETPNEPTEPISLHLTPANDSAILSHLEAELHSS